MLSKEIMQFAKRVGIETQTELAKRCGYFITNCNIAHHGMFYRSLHYVLYWN